MTIKQIVDELEFVDRDIKVCKEKINNPQLKRKDKAEYRKRLQENYHQKMHLECVLVSVKCDPLF